MGIIAIIGVLVVMVAFINFNNKKKMQNNFQTNKNEGGFAVVELFTSEGCSSCPPADELVEKIQKDNKEKPIYILAFHVDYWDHQGWKDSFGDPAFSKRQVKYAQWLSLRGLYTPQVVVNGTSEYVGSDRGPILDAISTGLNQGSAKSLMLNYINGKINVDYKEGKEDQDSELILAFVQKSAQSNVRAGENSGRNLSHVQIVKRLITVPVSTKQIDIEIPTDLKSKGWELIGLVQHKTDGHITAAGRFDSESGNDVSK
jgi:hypothetical protein